MKTCKDINDKLSLYLDNEISPQEKHAMEEHIKTCSQCAQTLADLQKVKAMTSKLSEVDPPAWFKQKIMAKVRAEAEKKSFAEKWFYPLRIKVPVQVFATIFIVVIAVYIYRGGNEQFKEVMPPAATAPVLEEQKAELAVNQDVPAAVAARPTKKRTEVDKSCEGNACEISELKVYDSAGEALSVGKGKLEPKAAASPVLEKDIEAESSAPRMKSRSMQAAMGKTESFVQSKKENNVIIIRTSEVQSATAQVEKILAEYSAAKVSRQSIEAKVVFRAEISKEKLKDFIEKLKKIGMIEEKVLADITALEHIPVVIEIQKK
jgi:hypothetical protein